MTPQEIFDTVATHLFTQGHPARAGSPALDGTLCVYKAPNGDTCAVGCLIQDYYVPEMDQDFLSEGTGVSVLVNRFGDMLPTWVKTNTDLLRMLQCAHDNNNFWLSVDNMKAELRYVSKQFDLDSSVLNKFYKFGEHKFDLVISPERKSVWMNWYAAGAKSGGQEYETRGGADSNAGNFRTHVLEIITEDDEPVDVKIHKVTK